MAGRKKGTKDWRDSQGNWHEEGNKGDSKQKTAAATQRRATKARTAAKVRSIGQGVRKVVQKVQSRAKTAVAGLAGSAGKKTKATTGGFQYGYRPKKKTR